MRAFDRDLVLNGRVYSGKGRIRRPRPQIKSGAAIRGLRRRQSGATISRSARIDVLRSRWRPSRDGGRLERSIRRGLLAQEAESERGQSLGKVFPFCRLRANVVRCTIADMSSSSVNGRANSALFMLLISPDLAIGRASLTLLRHLMKPN